MSESGGRFNYVEPILFIIILAANLQGFSRQALIYQKSCGNLYRDCAFLQSKTSNNLYVKEKRLQVQLLSDNILTINSALMVAVPVLASLLSGVQIDKGRYKQSLSLPIIGTASGCLFLMFIVHFDLGFLMIYLSTILSFFLGSVVVLVQTCYSYISSTVSEERLSSRLLIAEVVVMTAVLVSNNIGGYLADLKQLDYSFLVCLTLYVISAFYGLAAISDLAVAVPDEDKPVGFFRQIFSVLIKPRKSRGLIWMYLLCYLLTYLAYNCFNSVNYLYMVSDPFVMTNQKYAIVISISGVGGLLFGMFSSHFLLGKNKSGHRILGDTSYAIIACLSNLIGFVIMGLATNVYMIYISAVFMSCQTITAAILRSILVKLVDADEKGRIFCLIFLLQSFSAILGNTIALQVYRLTLTIYPGMIFFLICGFVLFVMFFLIYRLVVERRQEDLL